jgi:hypothetical protein
MKNKNNLKGGGSKTWYVADGWIPRKNKTEDSKLEGHEALIILNYQSKDAEIFLDIFFEDKEPIEDIKISVPSKRVRCFRMDNPKDIGGVEIERLTQYALRIKSNIEVIVQFGRMDITQDNLAYACMFALPE